MPHLFSPLTKYDSRHFEKCGLELSDLEVNTPGILLATLLQKDLSNDSIDRSSPHSEHKQTHIAGWKTYQSCFLGIRVSVKADLICSPAELAFASILHLPEQFVSLTSIHISLHPNNCEQTAKDNDRVITPPPEFYISAQRSFALYPCFLYLTTLSGLLCNLPAMVSFDSSPGRTSTSSKFLMGNPMSLKKKDMIEFHGEACSRNQDVTDENRTQNIHALGGENGHGKKLQGGKTGKM